MHLFFGFTTQFCVGWAPRISGFKSSPDDPSEIKTPNHCLPYLPLLLDFLMVNFTCQLDQVLVPTYLAKYSLGVL